MQPCCPHGTPRMPLLVSVWFAFCSIASAAVKGASSTTEDPGFQRIRTISYLRGQGTPDGGLVDGSQPAESTPKMWPRRLPLISSEDTNLIYYIVVPICSVIVLCCCGWLVYKYLQFRLRAQAGEVRPAAETAPNAGGMVRPDRKRCPYFPFSPSAHSVPDIMRRPTPAENPLMAQQKQPTSSGGSSGARLVNSPLAAARPLTRSSDSNPLGTQMAQLSQYRVAATTQHHRVFGGGSSPPARPVSAAALSPTRRMAGSARPEFVRERSRLGIGGLFHPSDDKDKK